jgi:hypothetical protein
MTIINSVSQPFPNVWSYPFELPGDSVLARTELYLGDVRAGICKKIETEKWDGQQLFVVNADGVNDRLYFMRVKRTRKKVEFCSADAKGKVKVLIAETYDPTFNDLMFSCKIINGGIDNYSRIDTVPLMIARTCSGEFVNTVAKPNIQPLLD